MSEARNIVADVIEALGGPTKASELLDVRNPSVVINWRTRGRIPADKVIAVETLAGVSRHVLRPDIFGPEPSETAA